MTKQELNNKILGDRVLRYKDYALRIKFNIELDEDWLQKDNEKWNQIAKDNSETI